MNFSEFLSINLSVIPIAALATWLGKVWATRIANHETSKLNQDLETLKSQLQIESLKASSLHDKRSQVYMELYGLCEKCFGDISEFFGFSFRPTYTEWGLADFIQYMKQRNCTKKEIETFKEKHNASDPEDAIKYLDERLVERRFGKAREMHQNSTNYRYLNTLVVSDEVATQVDAFLKHVWDALVDYEMIHFHKSRREKHLSDGRESVKNAKSLLPLIANTMRREMFPVP